MYLYALAAAFTITLLSLVGGLFFGKKTTSSAIHHYMLPLAIGVFLGVVFFELIPETLEVSHEWGPVAIVFGFLGFYLLSHILHTYHHHHSDDSDHCIQHGARMLLIGDAIHNIADGVVVASAFMINPMIGILTTIGVALHEIPQEIAEFGILMRSGCTRTKALFYNFISASSIFVGVLFTYLFAETLSGYVFILTGIASGNLLYIATADLIPELQHSHKEHFKGAFIAMLLGLIMIGTLILFGHE